MPAPASSTRASTPPHDPVPAHGAVRLAESSAVWAVLHQAHYTIAGRCIPTSCT